MSTTMPRRCLSLRMPRLRPRTHCCKPCVPDRRQLLAMMRLDFYVPVCLHCTRVGAARHGRLWRGNPPRVPCGWPASATGGQVLLPRPSGAAGRTLPRGCAARLGPTAGVRKSALSRSTSGSGRVRHVVLLASHAPDSSNQPTSSSRRVSSVGLWSWRRSRRCYLGALWEGCWGREVVVELARLAAGGRVSGWLGRAWLGSWLALT